MMSMLGGSTRRFGVGMDKLVAAAVAAVAAVSLFLVPAVVLERAAQASGLSDMFAPLAPPLGMKARIGLALMVAGTVFGMMLVVTRFLMRPKAARAEPQVQDDLPPAPRLRRRDAHPDAPARAPISAMRDFGEPDEPVFPEQPRPVAREPEPEPQPQFRPEPTPEPAPEPRREGRGRPSLEEILAAREEAAGEPAAVPEAPDFVEPAAPAFAPEPEFAEESWSPEPLELQMEQALEPEPEPAWDALQEPAGPPASRPMWMVETAPEPAAAEPREENLSDLLARFEQALARKVAAPVRPRRAADAQPAELETDARLRSALDNLKRFAVRAG